MSRFEEAYEVAVIGAGPGGLASGITLGSYGIETLVLDRRSRASTLPRATVATTATMELLRRWGLERLALERSLEVEWRAWACGTLAAAGDGEAVEVGLPTRAEAALVSPSAPACLPQDELEPLLEGRLRSLPSARVERGVELLALERATGGGWNITVARTGESPRRIRARYLVGADGVRSTVRSELGIAVEGAERLETRLGVLFRAPLWELLGEHRYGIYFVAGERAFIPAGRPDRWAFARAWDDSLGDPAALPTTRIEGWIRAAAGDPELPIEIEDASRVSFGVGLAERFRDGDAFLIGDAAHRVTPRGGTGLNTAIGDGFDLGWKLAWVVRGWAGDELLDTYERERRPVAEFNLERSSQRDGSILAGATGLNLDLGGRIAHAWAPREDRLVSTIDLLGDGLTLLAGPDWDGPPPAALPGSPPIAIERLDTISARTLGLAPGGALLARPDGQPLVLSNRAAAEVAVAA